MEIFYKMACANAVWLCCTEIILDKPYTIQYKKQKTKDVPSY